MNSDTYCVIMAGGIGSRFWPLSQTHTPKQFLDILGTGKTLIQQTYERFLPVCPKENFIIVTSSEYINQTLEQLPELTKDQILCEPYRRNTAPCIAYANAVIKKKNENAKIIVSPADHLILKETEFHEIINDSLEFISKNNSLLTLGIKPSRAETGYGYIQQDLSNRDANNNAISQVKTFTEKPNIELARIFLDSGDFLWNSGIFIWSLKSIDAAFNTYLNDIYILFNEKINSIGTDNEEEVIKNIYSDCQNISIDYGVMEKATNVYVYESDFGWSDLGTWSTLFDHSLKDSNSNAINQGKCLVYDTKNSIINISKEKIAVIQGLDNYIVVETNNALLICPKDNEQQIKQFTNDVNAEFGENI